MNLLKEATIDFREAQMALAMPTSAPANVTNVTNNNSSPQSSVTMTTPIRSRSSFVPDGL